MDNFTELQDLLTSMKDNLDKLLVIENQKTTILEKGSVDDLNNLMNTEQALIMECSAEEKQRIKLCDNAEVHSISELIKKYPETEPTIHPLHINMVKTIDNIKKVSTLNMKLIETRMKIIKFMTSQFGITTENATYSKTAQIV